MYHKNELTMQEVPHVQGCLNKHITMGRVKKLLQIKKNGLYGDYMASPSKNRLNRHLTDVFWK